MMYDVPDGLWGGWLKAPFEEAASSGDIPLTTALMEAGAEGDGIIPAVEGGHHRLVRDLLEMGASPTVKDDEGDAPIHLAAANGHGLIVRTLLIEGVDFNEPDRLGRTPLHLACMSGDDVGVRVLLAVGACPLDRHESTDFCALDFAAWNGHVNIMKTLLGKGTDVNARGRDGRCCLHQAADSGGVGVIQFLSQEAGVDIDCKDGNGITPLHLAARRGHLPAVNALVAAGADVNLRTDEEYWLGYEYGLEEGDCSALDFAAHAGRVDILETLIRHGADATAVGKGYGKLSPLSHAACAKKLGAIEFLLDKGADANAGANGLNPVYCAVQANFLEAIQPLARHGADLNESGYDTGPPLNHAANTLNFDMVRALLAAGADPNHPVEEEVMNALWWAVSLDAKSLDMCKLLVEHGADVNGGMDDEETALHNAVALGTVEVIDFLLKAGAAVDGLAHGIKTPLHVACDARLGRKWCDVLKALLGHGAALNSRDGQGNTPLHVAAASLSIKKVDFLLRAGADETIVNVSGKTPAGQLARGYGRRYQELAKSVVRLLEGAPADRTWRRRGLLVLCRALPDKARLVPERTRVKLPRAAKSGVAGWNRGRRADGELVGAGSDGAFPHVVSRLVGLDQEDVFRKIVCLL